ncbi:unnamed protein product [Mytilus edulis]|uniref:B box-type domain-containing protein n=1 Tax=Mytilus edulis TaxID=6550 RepID=A0A8S3UJL5_MYTED|nr:unnamed protein product [Mytilus edulis]
MSVFQVLLLTCFMTLMVTGHKSCSRNAGLMKSIQYQLKLVEDNDGKCDCTGRVSESGKVAFMAKNSATLENVPAKSAVAYNTVITNLGNGFDKSTGIFTAPSNAVLPLDDKDAGECFIEERNRIRFGVKAFCGVHVMASSKPILCGPCHKGEVNTKADIWCYNCDEGLCATCLSQHKRSKVTRDHKTIDIKSYKLTIAEIKTECDKHGQQLNLYCPSHLMPCCIKKSVKVIRKEINKHLDHLEKKLCDETDTIWKQEKSKAADFIYEINGKLENLKEMKETVHTITEHNISKLQSFLGVHQIEQQVHQFQRYADNLEKDERVKEVDITMKQNDEIEKVISKLGSIKALAEVMVVKTDLNLQRKLGVGKEAQVEYRENPALTTLQ